MEKKAASAVMMSLLLTSMLTLAFYTQLVRGVSLELVKHYDGQAVRTMYWDGEITTVDSPPTYASPGPYPYEFSTAIPSHCILKIRQALWPPSPTEPNTLNILLDGSIVFSATATWDNLIDGGPTGEPYSIDLGFLASGLHFIELRRTYDNWYFVDWWEVWYQPAQLSARISIVPETLNLKSKGQWITAYIQLPEGYDPADVDASTILLNGTVSPVLDPKYGWATDPSGYLIDYNNDGVLERMVKFDRAQVESWIYHTQGISYGNVALTVTGNLIDGTPFEGTDIIFVNYPGDANHDGTINMVDLSFVSAHWYSGPPTGPLGYDVNADFNRDGAIDLLEVAIISANWGQTVP